MREWFITPTLTPQNAEAAVIGFMCDGALLGTISCPSANLTPESAFREFVKDQDNWLTQDRDLHMALLIFQHEVHPDFNYGHLTFQFVSDEADQGFDKPWRFTNDRKIAQPSNPIAA